MTPEMTAYGKLRRWWGERVLSRAIFLKQRLGRAERCFVTCPGNQDGIGAMIQARLSCMLYTHGQGLTYVHTPMAFVLFAPAHEPDWAGKWERFFGLGAGELDARAVASELGEPRRVNNPTQIRMIRNSFWSLPHCHAYADLYPHQYQLLTERFAARYHAAPKEGCVSHYTPGMVNVAVHLRRGDVAHRPNLASREDYGEAILRQLTDALRELNRPHVIRVFSDGSESEFEALRRFGVEFHMKEDLFSSFHSLVNADVLVMAKSGFSYSAGLLSRGLVIYEPTHHACVPRWLAASRNGRLDQGRLRRELRSIR